MTFPHDHDPRNVSDHLSIVVRTNRGTGSGGGGGTTDGVRFVELLPNPSGDEMQNESVALKNFRPSAGRSHGWGLRDSANTTWSLDSLGTLAAGEQRTMERDGQSMGMNNSGDTITLIDPQGNVVQSVRYGDVDDDEVITVNAS